MLAILKGDVLDLQTKIEYHPGRPQKQVTYAEMEALILAKFSRPKKEFEPAKCSVCGADNLFWVTDPKTQKRILVEELNSRLYYKINNILGEVESRHLTDTYYVKHNILHPECLKAIQAQKAGTEF